MELITCNVEALHLGFADLDALPVVARIERSLDFQAGRGHFDVPADNGERGSPSRSRREQWFVLARRASS
jgi:hypothetical protein